MMFNNIMVFYYKNTLTVAQLRSDKKLSQRRSTAFMEQILINGKYSAPW